MTRCGGGWLASTVRCLVCGWERLVDVGLRSAVMGIVMCACGTDEELVAKNGLYIKVTKCCDLLAWIIRERRLRYVRTLLENRVALVANSNWLNPVGCFYIWYTCATPAVYNHSIIPAKCSVLQSNTTSLTTGGVVHARILHRQIEACNTECLFHWTTIVGDLWLVWAVEGVGCITTISELTVA